jgi:fibro-slime domain-containing protein
MWVFFDGRLVSQNLQGIHTARASTVNLDTVVTQYGLTRNQNYRASFFFAHRRAGRSPYLKLQLTNSTVCNALSAGVTVFDYQTITSQNLVNLNLQGDSVFSSADSAVTLVSSATAFSLGSCKFLSHDVSSTPSILQSIRS